MSSEVATALRERFAETLASGALEPIETELHEIEDGGVRFAVRLVVGSDRKRGPFAPPGNGNPFLPFEEALYAGDLGEDHVCLLNKYPVMRDHALVITREFVDQEAPLEASDFAAVWSLVQATDGLGFYNAGRLAGASQPHRHFQVVPTPLAPFSAGAATPIDPILDEARFDEALGRAPGLPFLHAVARLRSCQQLPTPEAAAILHRMTQEMAGAFGCNRPGRPYNLLLTRDWLLFVPRSREAWQGISLNALAFGGALLVREREGLDRLRDAGPMTALRHAGIASP